MRENYLRVGVLTSTHGIRGEMNVFPTTDDIKRFDTLSRVFVDTASGKAAIKRDRGLVEMKVTGVKYFKNMVILKFEGYDKIEDIEQYKGLDLLVAREDAIPLADGEHFICDIIGLKVVTDEGENLGVAYDMLETGANNVLVVKTEDEKEILVPYVPQFIKNVDIDGETLTVHLIDGMRE